MMPDRQGTAIFPLALPSGDPKHLPLPDPLITACTRGANPHAIARGSNWGATHEIRRLDDLALLYAQVAADLRSLYSIAYQPTNPGSRDGKWQQSASKLRAQIWSPPQDGILRALSLSSSSKVSGLLNRKSSGEKCTQGCVAPLCVFRLAFGLCVKCTLG